MQRALTGNSLPPALLRGRCTAGPATLEFRLELAPQLMGMPPAMLPERVSVVVGRQASSEKFAVCSTQLVFKARQLAQPATMPPTACATNRCLVLLGCFLGCRHKLQLCRRAPPLCCCSHLGQLRGVWQAHDLQLCVFEGGGSAAHAQQGAKPGLSTA
jgi:hypothetical protein